MRGSFVGGSFIEGAPSAPETEEQKAEREKKEFMNSFKILSKEESLEYTRRKDFDLFLAKTGRIIERALDNNVDIVGDFFADDDDEESSALKKNKGDKISQ